MSAASFGAGITVNSLTVADATDATANITISPTATVGARMVTVTTSRTPTGFVRFLAGAPDEMDALVQLPHSKQGRTLNIDLCYCGDLRMGNDLARPLRALKPQNESVRVTSYLEAQAAGGFLLAPVAHFQTDLFLRELSEPAIAAITTGINNAPVGCKVVIVPLRGAISRVNVSDMAYAPR